MNENQRIRRRIISYFTVGGGLLLVFVLLWTSTWKGNTQLHTLMEVVATLLSLFVGIVALVRFYTRQNNTYLFIGTGFLGTALLDGYHAIVTSSYFAHLFPSVPDSLIPWSWVASRFFLSLMLFLSWWAWHKEKELREARWFSNRTVLSLAVVLTVASFLFFAFVPLPRAYYPELFFGRPEEFVPGLLFLLALIGYVRKGKWKTDPFEHWLVLSIIVGLVGQVVFMTFSYTLFDGMFDMAHSLKKVSYVFVLVGLLISMFHLFRQAENSAEEIRVTGEALRESEAQFRDLYDNAPAAYLAVGRDGRIRRANQQTAHLLGYALDDVIGRPIFDLYADTPDGKEKARQVFQRFLAGEQTRGEELQMRHSDGHLIWISLTVDPVRSAEGEILETRSIVIDITERKQAEERFQLLLEFAPIAMIIVNKRGEMVLVNALTETLFGYPQEELLGKPVEMLVPESGRTHHPSYREGYSHTPELKKMGEGRDLSGLRKDGSEVSIEVSLRPITVGDEALVVSAIVDITERKRSEEAFRLYAEELKRSNEELEQFAYIASHDLQEPLRKIQAFGDRVRSKYKDVLDERGHDYLQRMQDAASRMQSLITDLLLLSRVTSKAQPFVEVDLDQVVNEVLSDLEVRIERIGGQVEVNDLPTIKADPMQMRQLLQNLISNALKFRREDRPPSVKVYGRALPGNAARGVRSLAYQIHVEDNGIGFDEKYLDRIFKPFQRLHGRNVYEGSGIGLAICQKIAERHGGDITAKSTPGEGATFTITLNKKPGGGDVS